MLCRTSAPLLLLALPACCMPWSGPSREGIERWHDGRPPSLAVPAKAAAYQARLEERFLTPEGVLRYARRLADDGDRSYGNLADGAFHTGIYLASQALRARATGLAEAREQARRALGGLRLLMEATGKRGLLSRHISPAGTVKGDPRWIPSPTRPAYDYRSDVSKDQYAGFIHGLGVALAVSDDPELRAGVAELAGAAADHLLANDLQIVDAGGRRTTFGDLRGRFLGIPLGPNAAISLAIAKVAAESSGEERHRALYRRLVEEGYPRLAGRSHFPLGGFLDRGKRVNLNLTYLALYPLLLLEKDPAVLSDLRAAERGLWERVREERNAFFSFVHAGAVEGPPARHSKAVTGGAVPSGAVHSGAVPGEAAAAPEPDGAAQGRAALAGFPDDKVEWPVDLTRDGSRFPRAFLRASDCIPRSTVSIPLHLRPRSSSFWASNPYRLAGDLGARGEAETAGMDFLQAYWIGRFHGLVE